MGLNVTENIHKKPNDQTDSGRLKFLGHIFFAGFGLGPNQADSDTSAWPRCWYLLPEPLHLKVNPNFYVFLSIEIRAPRGWVYKKSLSFRSIIFVIEEMMKYYL